ncbi:MAG: DNA/RNA nuclease SfsA [Candidatus Korarchaeota archaeon]
MSQMNQQLVVHLNVDRILFPYFNFLVIVSVGDYISPGLNLLVSKEVLKLDVRECIIIRKVNRFTVEVATKNEVLRAHLANTGKLVDVIVPGRSALIAKTKSGKLKYRLIAVEDLYGKFCIIDTITQNNAFVSSVEAHLIPYLMGYHLVKRNIRMLSSIFDFYFKRNNESLIVETKSAVMRGPAGEAMYPDTVSIRGRRHIFDLIKLSLSGYKVMIVFIAALYRPRCFKPSNEDPVITNLIRKAKDSGVELRAISMYMECDGKVIIENPDLPVCII